MVIVQAILESTNGPSLDVIMPELPVVSRDTFPHCHVLRLSAGGQRRRVSGTNQCKDTNVPTDTYSDYQKSCCRVQRASYRALYLRRCESPEIYSSSASTRGHWPNELQLESIMEQSDFERTTNHGPRRITASAPRGLRSTNKLEKDSKNLTVCSDAETYQDSAQYHP